MFSQKCCFGFIFLSIKKTNTFQSYLLCRPRAKFACPLILIFWIVSRGDCSLSKVEEVHLGRNLLWELTGSVYEIVFMPNILFLKVFSFHELLLDSCYLVPILLSNLYMRWQRLCTAECVFSSLYSTVASVEIDLCATQNIPSPGKRGIDFFFLQFSSLKRT